MRPTAEASTAVARRTVSGLVMALRGLVGFVAPADLGHVCLWWGWPVVAALAGETLVGARDERSIGQAHEFAVLKPLLIAAVELRDEDLGEAVEHGAMLRGGREVTLLAGIFVQIEQLAPVPGGV